MGNWIKLTASDGHQFDGYLAMPSGRPRGGLVVIQEIFGVNRHMRAVTDRFAADGYAALAPALFDRVERNVDVGYDGAGIAKGRTVREGISYDQAMRDTAAAVARIRAAVPTVPVHTYPAGHGFNCEERKDYDAASAALAQERTLAHFAEHVG